MIQLALGWAATTADAVGVAVILIGFVMAVVRFVPSLLGSRGPDAIHDIQMIRCNLGTYLVFALELMIVSDLLHSVISHSLEDLYFLAAIVVLRTVIAYFLNKEIQELGAAH
ncbi:MAG: DUF1622 domain-containing protein [Gammaproteobacteria bacterium]|nr:DUF1622 domain-containing protein [Gammaproteobacteria bacterium]